MISVDFFRGFSIMMTIFLLNVWPVSKMGEVYTFLNHSEWHGWTFTDLWFPFFIFIMGVSIPLSLGRRIESGSTKSQLLPRILRRTLILFALGLVYNGFPTYDLATLRIMGVLQRIALCYLFASIIYLACSRKQQIGLAFTLLFIYWAITAPSGYGVENNLPGYVDRLLLNGRMFTKTYDPEGFLSTIPAISMAVFGLLAVGLFKETHGGLSLMSFGAFAAFSGCLWSQWLPMNRWLWTSSFVLFVTGFALIFLGVCHYLFDLKGYGTWAKPLIPLGANALPVYFVSLILDRLHLSDWAESSVDYFAYAVAQVLLMVVFAWILYRMRIFIRA